MRLDQGTHNDSSSYRKAYISLKAFPLELSHPCESKQLTGIGDKIVNQLTAKLQAHCEQNGLTMPKKPRAKGEETVPKI